MPASARPAKEDLFMGYAVMASRMSTCRRLQVGCVLTDDLFEQVAFGYNGTYKGGPNECLHPANQGACGCVHAETNAVIKCRFRPHHAFVTDSPCPLCAAALVNAGIRILHYAREYRNSEGLDILHAAGVELVENDPREVDLKLQRYFTLDVTSSVYGWRIDENLFAGRSWS